MSSHLREKNYARRHAPFFILKVSQLSAFSLLGDYLLLCLFFLNLFLRLCVAILCPFFFFPFGIALKCLNCYYYIIFISLFSLHENIKVIKKRDVSSHLREKNYARRHAPFFILKVSQLSAFSLLGDYLLLCLFFLNLFLRLCVAILCPFFFFPFGIALKCLNCYYYIIFISSYPQ